MKTVRIGLAGLGGMGTSHARQIHSGAIPGATLNAVADPFSDIEKFGEGVKGFRSAEEMMTSGEIDAVIIATPHYSHTTLGIAALDAGLHVLVEKPISVHKSDAERLIAAHKNPKQVFAAMFNVRTEPVFQKIRELITSGELGEIRRISWIVTTWFRSDAYYRSGGWRATWEGEGGGVLLNQCPHNLDLLYWLFGMPSSVRAFCRFGHYHDIEVEDDVTAYLEYPNGANGVFITTTGEAPGTNRLEIAAERGHLVLENNQLRWTRNEIPTSQYCRETKSAFGIPGVWNVDLPIRGSGEHHRGIMKNFVNAILNDEPLIAPAAEGIYSVELANAMLLSQFTDSKVQFPIDGPVYQRLLDEKIAASPRSKKNQ